MAVELDAIRKRALKLAHRIVLVDGEDDRVIEAAAHVAREGSLKPVLIGDEGTIRDRLRTFDSETDIEVIDPRQSPLVDEFAAIYRRKREGRGKPVSEEVAVERVVDRSYFAVLLLETGRVNGAVGGGGSAHRQHIEGGPRNSRFVGGDRHSLRRLRHVLAYSTTFGTEHTPVHRLRGRPGP